MARTVSPPPVPRELRPLTERTLGRVVPVEISGSEWHELVGLASWGRLLSVLGVAVGEGIVAVDDTAREAAVELLRRQSALAVKIERTAVEVSGALSAEGIDHRLLKGVALAQLDYPEPTLRSMSDLDLLVPREDHRRAVEILTERFHASRRDEVVEPRYEERFNHSATLVTDAGVEADVHRTLVKGPFGQWMEPALLFERSRPLRLAGVDLPALCAEDALVHACYVMLLSDPEIIPRPLLDIAVLARRADLDWDRVWSVADAWRGTTVVDGALALVERWLDVPVERRTPSRSRFEHLCFDLDALPNRHHVARHALTMGAHPTWRGRIRYTVGVARSPAGGSVSQRVQRAVDTARQRGVGRRSSG